MNTEAEGESTGCQGDSPILVASCHKNRDSLGLTPHESLTSENCEGRP